MTNDKIVEAFEKYYGAPLTEGTSAFTMNQHIAWEAWQAATLHQKKESDALIRNLRDCINSWFKPTSEKEFDGVIKKSLAETDEYLGDR